MLVNYNSDNVPFFYATVDGNILIIDTKVVFESVKILMIAVSTSIKEKISYVKSLSNIPDAYLQNFIVSDGNSYLVKNKDEIIRYDSIDEVISFYKSTVVVHRLTSLSGIAYEEMSLSKIHTNNHIDKNRGNWKPKVSEVTVNSNNATLGDSWDETPDEEPADLDELWESEDMDYFGAV